MPRRATGDFGAVRSAPPRLMICVSSADVVTGAGLEVRWAGAGDRCGDGRLKMTVLSMSSDLPVVGGSAGGTGLGSGDRGLATADRALDTAGPPGRFAARRERASPSVTKVMTNAAAVPAAAIAMTSCSLSLMSASGFWGGTMT